MLLTLPDEILHNVLSYASAFESKTLASAAASGGYPGRKSIDVFYDRLSSTLVMPARQRSRSERWKAAIAAATISEIESLAHLRLSRRHTRTAIHQVGSTIFPSTQPSFNIGCAGSKLHALLRDESSGRKSARYTISWPGRW